MNAFCQIPLIRQSLLLLPAIQLILLMSNTAKSQIAIPNPVCYGDPINLFCIVSGCGMAGATYHWENTSGSWTSNQPDPVIPVGVGYASDNFYLTVQFNPPPGGFSGGRIAVVVWPEIIISGTISPVTCSPGNDGCIDISVSGGTPGFTYQWSGGPTTQDVCNLSCGTYTVTVTDSKGCKGIKSWDVTTNMVLTGIIHPASCSPGNDAWIDLSVSGGCPPFSYAWSNMVYTQDISGLVCGATYCVTVTDAIGCYKTACWTYLDLIVTAVVTDETGAGCCDGSIVLNVTCGTPPYTYAWSFGPTIKDLDHICSGTYCVTVTDANLFTRTCCWNVAKKKSTCQTTYVPATTLTNGMSECYDAVQTVVVGGTYYPFVVQNGGSATMIAGGKITYMEGTRVYPGGYMHGNITSNGQYCSTRNFDRDTDPEGIISDSIQNINISENRLFNVYPNPTSGNFILELNTEKQEMAKVEIYTTQGTKVMTAGFQGVRKHEFSLSDKPAGVYFIRVVTGKYAGTSKIIRQ